MNTLLIHDDDQGIRTITLNRPEALNAVTEEMTTELSAALKEAAKTKSVRCLVLTGAGRAFCVGQDLKTLRDSAEKGTPMDFAAALRQRYNPIIERLADMPMPVLASVNGVAAGAGWSLALAADLRIASDKASFVSAFSKIGLIPDSGMTQTLTRLVGPSRALEIAWLSDGMSAEHARQWGLVNQVVEDARLGEATTELARRLAASATKALVMTRRAVRAALGNDLPAQLEYEAQLQGAAGATRDHQEGVAAFLGKRAAVFTGE